jgi:GT2 family glycosyltransferase
MSNKVLSIVIPVFNKYNFTKACLDDLSKLPEDHEIIVVDNASSDETAEALKDNPRIVYHRNPTNLGFAKACNIGYALTSAPNVLFLNNDIRVKSNHTNWTAPLLEKCGDGLVGPTMGQLDDQLNFVQEANKVLEGKSYMSGWCLAASKETWQKLTINRHPHMIVMDAFNILTDSPQVFSEEFGIAYFEDTDLSFRARKLGIPMHVVEIPVVHFGKQTSSQLNTYQLYKSARQIFVNKWTKYFKL